MTKYSTKTTDSRIDLFDRALSGRIQRPLRFTKVNSSYISSNVDDINDEQADVREKMEQTNKKSRFFWEGNHNFFCLRLSRRYQTHTTYRLLIIVRTFVVIRGFGRLARSIIARHTILSNMRRKSTRMSTRRKRPIQCLPLLLIFAALYQTKGSIKDSISIQVELDAISAEIASNSSFSVIYEPTLQPPSVPVETAMVPEEATRQGDDGDNDGTMTRAIVAISMGAKAAESKMVERFVWSARHKGGFKGYIVLLTNAPAERYEGISNWTNNFITINPPDEHFSTEHKYLEMARKRFKTYVLEYLNLDSRLDSIKLVYYLDVDIVFGGPIQPFFEGLEEKYQIGRTLPDPDKPANMWMFEGNTDKWSIQGGQMILDRATSQPCLEQWRWYMDSRLSVLKDQVLLNMMVDDEKKEKKLKCKIVAMEQKGYIEFPEKQDMIDVSNEVKNSENRTSGRTYAPLVHIRNTGNIKKTSKWNYKSYLLDVLGMKKEEDTLDITSKQLLG